jgi:hypothetical protein
VGGEQQGGGQEQGQGFHQEGRIALVGGGRKGESGN